MRFEEFKTIRWVREVTHSNSNKYRSTFKTRPVKIEDSKVFKVTKAYRVYFDEMDIKLIVSYNHLDNALPQMKRLSYGHCISFINNLFNKTYYLLDEYKHFKTYINYIDGNFMLEEDCFSIYLSEDAVEQKIENAADKKRKARIKNKEAEQKVINTMLVNVVDGLCEKWNLRNLDGAVVFKNRKFLMEFFKKAFFETIAKDFAENGIEIKFNPRLQKITENSTLFKIEDMTLNIKE